MKWEKRGTDYQFAFVSRRRIDIRGRSFRSPEAVRAVRETAGWRIDRCEAVAGTWTPWEAIDATHYPNVTAAKRAIRAWFRG